MSEEQDREEEAEEDGEDGGGGHYGPAAATASGGSSWQAGEERRRRRDAVLRSVARVLLGIGRYIVQVRLLPPSLPLPTHHSHVSISHNTQPGNAYAGDEDVPRSACEGLLTFLERHLQPLWRRLGRASSQGD